MQEYFDYSAFEEISAEAIEKRKIRRFGLAGGVGLFALFAVMCFWPEAYFRITAIFGISAVEAANFANHPFFSKLFHIALSAIMIVLPFFIVSKSMGFKPSRSIPFCAAKKGFFLPSVLLGVGMCFFSSLSTNYADWIFDLFGVQFPSGSRETPLGIFGFIISVMSTAFFPAFFEELAMRGMVMGMLRKFGDAFAIIGSAFIFGIMHANADQIVFAFLVGIILGFITIKSDSIWPAITVHFLNNFVSVAFSYLKKIDGLTYSVSILSVFSLFMLLAVYSLAVLQKKDADYLKLSAEGEVSQLKKVIWFLTSPTIIISTIFSLAIAFFLR